MKYKLIIALLCSSLALQAQHKISSIDFQYPVDRSLYGPDFSNPWSLGITIDKDSNLFQKSLRIAAFNHGGFLFPSYQDTARGYFSSDDNVIYKIPNGDSVLTKTKRSFNTGVGVQVGFRRDYKLLNIPFYTSMNLGLYAHKFQYDLALSHTIYSPDTTDYGNGYRAIEDYTEGTAFNVLKDHGWSLLPQAGVEVGVVLSAGNRIKVIPKLALNLSYYRTSTIIDPTIVTTQIVGNKRAFDLQSAPTIQIAYVLR